MSLKSKYCSVCGTSFSCGSLGGGHGCWCEALPHIGQPDAKEGCMCPGCLKQDMKKKIDAFVKEFKAGRRENIAPQYRDNKGRMIPDLDYYMENGKWVFTEWFHLKRGDCCGSGCRHCPFEHKNVVNK